MNHFGFLEHVPFIFMDPKTETVSYEEMTDEELAKLVEKNNDIIRQMKEEAKGKIQILNDKLKESRNQTQEIILEKISNLKKVANEQEDSIQEKRDLLQKLKDAESTICEKNLEFIRNLEEALHVNSLNSIVSEVNRLVSLKNEAKELEKQITNHRSEQNGKESVHNSQRLTILFDNVRKLIELWKIENFDLPSDSILIPLYENINIFMQESLKPKVSFVELEGISSDIVKQCEIISHKSLRE